MNGYKYWVAAICGLLLIGDASGTLADQVHLDEADRIGTEASVAAGYRGTSAHGSPGRAREFDSLESGPLFKIKLFTDQRGIHLDLGAGYLNDDDYAAEAHLDAMGLTRLDLRTERFFHNLDHIPYATRPAADSGGVPRVDFSDQNPDDRYGLRLNVQEVKFRQKYPDFPAHFNLAYWRFEKEGRKQLRFVDENCAAACHMQSKTRRVDRVTEEVKAGADAHLGFFDVVLEGLFRSFRDRAGIPADDFGGHFRGRTAGTYEHDADPDSTLKELTLRANTAPSGGFTASASFTVGERENRSELTSLAPVKAVTDYYKGATDFTYTPSQHWTFNLRYRLLDLDNDNSSRLVDTVAGGNAFTSPLDVRPAMDITRAWYEAVAIHRPSPRLTLKGEFRREEIDRSNAAPALHPFHSPNPPAAIEINDTWNLPDEENITRVKFGFTSRHLDKSALKLNGWAAVQRNDDPAYGTSFKDSRELFLSGSYSPSPSWGMLASANLLSQENKDFAVRGYRNDTYEFTTDFDLAREKDQQNLSLGTWFTPLAGLGFDLNYGYFRTAIEQNVLFGRVTAPNNYVIPADDADYRQAVQTVTLGMNWQPVEKISCRLEGYHVRSKASFSPNFPTDSFNYNLFGTPYVGTASSADLKEISRLDIRQNGVRGRVNWQISDNLGCAVEATFDDYDERNSNAFDGSVQSYMASLSYTF